jgi:hypothetical protein
MLHMGATFHGRTIANPMWYTRGNGTRTQANPGQLPYSGKVLRHGPMIRHEKKRTGCTGGLSRDAPSNVSS